MACTATSAAQLALFTFISSLLIPTPVLSYIVFNFTSFPPNTPGINYSGDAYASGDNHVILTRKQVDMHLFASVGNVVYANPIQLWNGATGGVADFVTNFKFMIEVLNKRFYGDDIAFFMAPVGYKIPLNSGGKFLGLFNSTSDSSAPVKLVTVEFDTFYNDWDPDGNHIGIDLGSIESEVITRFPSDMKRGSAGTIRVVYNSTTSNLSVYLMYTSKDWYNENPTLSCSLNLKDTLPEKVITGLLGVQPEDQLNCTRSHCGTSGLAMLKKMMIKLMMTRSITQWLVAKEASVDLRQL